MRVKWVVEFETAEPVMIIKQRVMKIFGSSLSAMFAGFALVGGKLTISENRLVQIYGGEYSTELQRFVQTSKAYSSSDSTTEEEG